MTEREIVRRYLASDHPSREIGEIADELKTVAPEIMYILRDNGITFPRSQQKLKKSGRNKAMDKATSEKIKTMLADGEQPESIAARLGVSVKSIAQIRRHLSDNGEPNDNGKYMPTPKVDTDPDIVTKFMDIARRAIDMANGAKVDITKISGRVETGCGSSANVIGKIDNICCFIELDTNEKKPADDGSAV